MLYQNKPTLLDCTLRDGGFTNNFKWSNIFVKDYIKITNELPLEFIKLGYWKQKNKSKNKFYNISEEDLVYFKRKSKKKLSVIGDFHYQIKDVKNFPKKKDKLLDLIRMTCRIEDIDSCISFMNNLKEYTKIKTSINFFNFSNYTKSDIKKLAKKIPEINSDFIYFADTHGNMDFSLLNKKYNYLFKEIKKNNKYIGFHFHDNIGTAMSNYKFCIANKFKYFDVTINGIGRGGGNLRTEQIVEKKYRNNINKFILKHSKEIQIKDSIFYNITGHFGISNIYATYANKKKIKYEKFINFCNSIKGKDKDNFNISLIKKII